MGIQLVSCSLTSCNLERDIVIEAVEIRSRLCCLLLRRWTRLALWLLLRRRALSLLARS